MLITKLENSYRKSIKVYLDEEYAFLLYPGDLRKYQIEEGGQLSEEEARQIIEETVLRRAKQKVMALLKRMDYTEWELQRKLRMAGYTDAIAETAIQYVKSYHYVDDQRYADHYTDSKKGSQSRRQIQYNLRKKGVSSEIVSSVMDQLQEDETPAVYASIRKKTSKPIEELTWEEKQKIAAFLFRKGFRESDIRRCLQM